MFPLLSLADMYVEILFSSFSLTFSLNFLPESMSKCYSPFLTYFFHLKFSTNACYIFIFLFQHTFPGSGYLQNVCCKAVFLFPHTFISSSFLQRYVAKRFFFLHILLLTQASCKSMWKCYFVLSTYFYRFNLHAKAC